MKSKGFVSIILVIAVVLLLGAIGFFIYRYSKNQAPLSNINSNLSNGNPDYKEYSNFLYKFSIKYPSDWLLDTSLADKGELYILSPQRKSDMESGRIVKAFDVVVTAAPLLSAGDDLEKFISQQTKEGWLKDSNPKIFGTINGQKFYEVVEIGEDETYAIMAEKNGYIYTLETADGTKPSDTEKKILESFKIW